MAKVSVSYYSFYSITLKADKRQTAGRTEYIHTKLKLVYIRAFIKKTQVQLCIVSAQCSKNAHN